MKTTYGLRLEDLNTCRDFKQKKKKRDAKKHEAVKVMVDRRAVYVTLPGCADTVNRCVQS